jgi:uncharacterized protein YcaQ
MVQLRSKGSNDMAALPEISNKAARRLFLDRHGLARPPTGPSKGDDLARVIEDLGFVQIDSINTVARAHHMILGARRQSYRDKHLPALLDPRRDVFEHWTHDASIVPMAFFKYWRLKFERDGAKVKSYWKKDRRAGFEAKFDEVIRQIQDQGPCCSADVGEDEKRSSGGWWDWHPSKTALEYLWRSGTLSVTRREGFRKFYDLTENVVPPEHLNSYASDTETIDWACNAALDRLGFATSGELAAFWAIVTPAEARDWCAMQLARGDLIEVMIKSVDGASRKSFARRDILETAQDVAPPTSRLRIMSPFDPALRDRKRAERLFGFDYRIEIFVPEPQRKYGYYVFPVLEGDRLIGRIDMKCHRPENRMNVKAFWPEMGVRWGSGRAKKLTAEIERMARFSGAISIDYEQKWMQKPYV